MNIPEKKARFVELCEALLPETNAKNLGSLLTIFRDRESVCWVSNGRVYFENDYLWHVFKDKKPRLTKEGGVFINPCPEFLEVVQLSKELRNAA